MVDLAHARLNKFAPEAAKADFSARPPDQLIALTYGQLEELVLRAVDRATEPLKAVLQDLKDKTTKLEGDHDALADNQLNQLRIIKQLREQISRAPEPKESPLLDALYTEMEILGRKQVSFAEAAKILRVTRQRVQQLKAAIALDQRFIIVPSESHKQRLLIRLR